MRSRGNEFPYQLYLGFCKFTLPKVPWYKEEAHKFKFYALPDNVEPEEIWVSPKHYIVLYRDRAYYFDRKKKEYLLKFSCFR